jgi:hypothetical protein
VGDVIGCLFDAEEEIALFVPGSGDVLLSSLAQWRSLTCGDSAVSMPPPNLAQAAGISVESAADELKSALLSLGAAVE